MCKLSCKSSDCYTVYTGKQISKGEPVNDASFVSSACVVRGTGYFSRVLCIRLSIRWNRKARYYRLISEHQKRHSFNFRSVSVHFSCKEERSDDRYFLLEFSLVFPTALSLFSSSTLSLFPSVFLTVKWHGWVQRCCITVWKVSMSRSVSSLPYCVSFLAFLFEKAKRNLFITL